MLQFSTRADLFELIEEGELINESPSKREVECSTLLRRDGKLYMLTYLRSYSDGVDVDSAEIKEVIEKEVRRIDYIDVPGTTITRTHSKS